jgi:hypothetical protein
MLFARINDQIAGARRADRENTSGHTEDSALLYLIISTFEQLRWRQNGHLHDED